MDNNLDLQAEEIGKSGRVTYGHVIQYMVLKIVNLLYPVHYVYVFIICIVWCFQSSRKVCISQWESSSQVG